MPSSPAENVASTCNEIARNFQALGQRAEDIARAGQLLTDTLRRGNKVIFCGNGGSAADSQHLAAELMGRFLKDRAPLPAIALTTDTSALTAIGNDYGYEAVFERQLRGVGRDGDVLVAISTSGNSANVLAAARAAREMNIRVVALTGQSAGALEPLADLVLPVPAERTDHVQEMHIAVGHILCGMVERDLYPEH